MNKGYCKCKMGAVEIIEDDDVIVSLNFTDGKIKKTDDSPLIKKAVKQVEEYFAGKRKTFDLPVKVSGTPFQQRVLREVMKVGYGETASYYDIAKRIGNAKAVRAVGAANRQNNVPLIIPCHRIIGKDMSVKGYAGKQRIKIFLLTLEKNRLDVGA